MTLRVAIYARVSTKEQADYGTSLDSQLDRCRKYASDHGYGVVMQESDDHAGTDPVRPGINRIIDAARSRQIDVLICYDQDRFARGDEVFYALTAYLSPYVKIEFVTTGRLDTESFAGKLVAMVNALASGEEARKIRERTMRGKREAIGAGRLPVHGKPLYGYKTVARQGNRKRDTAISNDIISDIPGLQTAPQVVAWIFDQFVNHSVGATHIADKLNVYGIKAMYRSRWTNHMIRDILANEQYTGTFIRNRTIRVPNDEGRRNAKGKIITLMRERPKEQWIIIEREDLAIVSKSLFSAAKERIANGRGKVAYHEYLLNRRIKCVHGNNRVCHTTATSEGKAIRSYYTLLRNKFMKRENCGCKNIRTDKIDGIVWEWVVGLVNNPEKVLKAYRDMQEEAIEADSTTLQAVEDFSRSIKEAEGELEYLMEEAKEHRENQRLREMYRQQIKAQTAKIEALVKERDRLCQSATENIIGDEEIKNLVGYLYELNVDVQGLIAMPMREKRNIIELLDIRVITEPDCLVIVWYGTHERIPLNGNDNDPLKSRLSRSSAT